MTTAPNGQVESISAAAADQIAPKMRAVVEELSDAFFERSDVVRALVQAVLASQHALVLGPPGTAKSQLVRDLTGRIEDARLWETLLSRFTDPKQLFGPIDVAALTRGHYTQMFEGRATQAHVAFIDEIFKCNAAALNAMLALLNERMYHPEAGGAPIPCPLISAITASNELPPGEELSAIYDRLLVRVEVGYLVDPAYFARLVGSVAEPPVPAQRTTVSLAELQHAVRVAVPAVTVPEGVIDVICDLRAALRHKKLVTSDRRWRQGVRLLQAGAWLDGRGEVEQNDLSVLTHVLWDSPAQRSTVEREVLELINPDAGEAVDIADEIEALAHELDTKARQSAEALNTWGAKKAHPKLTEARRRLLELLGSAQAAGRSTATLDKVLARQRAVHRRVLVEALDVDASVVDARA